MFLVLLQSRQRYFFTFSFSFYFIFHFLIYYMVFRVDNMRNHTQTDTDTCVCVFVCTQPHCLPRLATDKAPNKWLTLRMSNVIVCSLCHTHSLSLPLTLPLSLSLKLIYYMYILRKGFISLSDLFVKCSTHSA